VIPCIGFWEEDESELLSRGPHYLDALVALEAEEETGQFHEHLVAGDVAVVHIESLEVIDVDERDPCAASPFCGLR